MLFLGPKAASKAAVVPIIAILQNKCIYFTCFGCSQRYPNRMIHRSIRLQVLERFKYKCIYCGFPSKEECLLVAEHFKPVGSGHNPFDYDNLVCACRRCNLIKSDCMFPTLKKAILYVENKIKTVNGLWFYPCEASKLPNMRETVPTPPQVAEILHFIVSYEALVANRPPRVRDLKRALFAEREQTSTQPP